MRSDENKRPIRRWGFFVRPLFAVRRLVTGFIPHFVPVRIIAAYLSLLSIPIPASSRRAHLSINRAEWERVQAKAMQGKYIEWQHVLTNMRYGNVGASFNCCEAIAAYNAMAAIGRKCDFCEVLCDFERRGLVLGGFFGTATDYFVWFFHDYGIQTKALYGRAITKGAMDSLAGLYDAFVLTMYNDRDNIFAQVHTVCITRRGGQYAVHNAGICGRRFVTLSDAVRASHGGKGKEILLVGVKNPKRCDNSH